ncbi:hypothetical protein ONZ45_g10750 [Pleurotus djamor]|nr:hypothetical protein ONZ45_g10750 [Pleurotus djamor]
MAHSNFIPNFGRPAGRPGPVGLWKYTEPDEDLPVTLIAIPKYHDNCLRKPLTFRDAHWMLAWNIGHTSSGHVAQRRLEVVNESTAGHLTNWGALTVADEPDKRPRMSIFIKKMTPAERHAFEVIADNTGIKCPDSGWNVQDWCIDVIRKAFRQSLISEDDYNRTVRQVQEVKGW